MNDVAIRVENLSKQYRIGGPQARYKTLRESLTEAVAAPIHRVRSVLRGQSSVFSNETIWALKDVSFEVKRGEVVGIIGRNGAGKTTLLKILSRITKPTAGYAEIHGRVGSLLEVGTGFHPELTGRENIYLNGAILGMKKVEIEGKFDEIVDFAEIERFLETPVKRYSSGMYVRLAFAVAAHLDPEILLVDEVLAVGDAAFQKKCTGKMGDVAKEGRTVLVVSHNMAIVRSLCHRCLLLTQGMVDLDDSADRVISNYMEASTKCVNGATVSLHNHPNRLPGMKPVLTKVRVLDESLQPRTDFSQSETIVIELVYDGRDAGQPLAGAGFILEAISGVRIGGFNTYMSPLAPHHLPERGVVHFRLRSPKLVPGRYLVTTSIGLHQHHLLDKVEQAVAFDVHPDDLYGTGFLVSSELGFVALSCDAAVAALSCADVTLEE